uniref:Uncharacterized protein n=1 Tax=Nelumbo nucifera TaxID=4432 RepID=A0A822XZC8_NELNU|nr:TPA_asm: hypothetical protein HUJ06_025628 [Nelumbo nucifera]
MVLSFHSVSISWSLNWVCFGSSSLESYSTSLHKNFLIKRKDKVYNEVVEGYFCMPRRTEGLEEAKSKIRSYTPGLWIEEVGGMKISDYELPKTTTLLLVGPGGSGKSSLVNRISKVFENDKFAPLRAQISYNSPVGEGTYFLQEYMIPRGSTSFCLYDTRSLSENSSENFEMIKNLMTKGVRHGELVTRCFDDSSVRKSMMCKAQQIGCYSSVVRRVDFVIFVVNALSVLQSTGNDHDHKSYKDILANSFSCPYLSFKDDKPVVVVTHGDLLTIYQRALVRIKLGELLGIPPDKQIFDIPGNCDPATELAIVEMLRYSLEHADRNLPCKRWVVDKVRSFFLHPSLLPF